MEKIYRVEFAGVGGGFGFEPEVFDTWEEAQARKDEFETDHPNDEARIEEVYE